MLGSPLLYGTSKHFLVHFGLNSLSDLPSMDEFDAFVGGLENIDIAAEGAEPGDEIPGDLPGDRPPDPAPTA